MYFWIVCGVAVTFAIVVVTKVIGFFFLPPTHRLNRILNPDHVPGSRNLGRDWDGNKRGSHAGGDGGGGSWDGGDCGGD